MVFELLNPLNWLQTTKAQFIFYAPLPYNKILTTFNLKEETISIGRVKELPVQNDVWVVKEIIL